MRACFHYLWPPACPPPSVQVGTGPRVQLELVLHLHLALDVETDQGKCIVT